MIYFMVICNTGVLLVSSGKILCDSIRAALMTHTNTHELAITKNADNNLLSTISITDCYCERSELSGEFNGTDFLSLYIYMYIYIYLYIVL